MSIELFETGLLGAGVVFLVCGAALAIAALRIASAGRAARAEADIRLSASQELAAEVKRLAERVEHSMQARDAAIENAFLRHNDACAASMHAAFGGKGGHDHHDGHEDEHHEDPHHRKDGHHDDHEEDGDHHESHHSGHDGHDEEDDHHHKPHHGKDGHHDDDDDGHDDDHHKHHAAGEAKPSLFARLLGRSKRAA